MVVFTTHIKITDVTLVGVTLQQLVVSVQVVVAHQKKTTLAGGNVKHILAGQRLPHQSNQLVKQTR